MSASTRQAPPRPRRLLAECSSSRVCRPESSARSTARGTTQTRAEGSRVLRERRAPASLCGAPNGLIKTLFLLALKTGMRQEKFLLSAGRHRPSERGDPHKALVHRWADLDPEEPRAARRGHDRRPSRATGSLVGRVRTAHRQSPTPPARTPPTWRGYSANPVLKPYSHARLPANLPIHEVKGD